MQFFRLRSLFGVGVSGVILAAFSPTMAEDVPQPERLPLWVGKAPIGDGTTEDSPPSATITVHRPPADKTNGAAIVICPGGGYGGLVDGPEGHGIAKWLVGHGITGVVLNYRLPKGRPQVPLLDAQQALRMVRGNSEKWHVNSQRVGIMGFSAGGHLASTAGTHFDAGDSAASDPVARASSRPDFVILIYPVVTMSGDKAHGGSRQNLMGANPKPELVEFFSNEKQVTDKTPPMFLAHAKDDGPVPAENSAGLYAALQAKKVPAEYLELPSGGHGLNGYRGPMWDAWQKRSLEWLHEQKLTSPPPAKDQ